MATEAGLLLYLSILFIDCGFTLAGRKAFMRKRFGREISFLDELTIAEASAAITELRDQKERGKSIPEEEDSNDSD